MLLQRTIDTIAYGQVVGESCASTAEMPSLRNRATERILWSLGRVEASNCAMYQCHGNFSTIISCPQTGTSTNSTDNAPAAFFVIEQAMKPLHALAAALLSPAMLGVCQAAPARFECPQSIPQSSVHLVAPKPSWKPFVSAPLYLNSAAPADGPPERLGILRGEDQKSTKSAWTYKYSLAGPFPEGKWLRCDYGTLGGFSLASRLPDEVQECTVKGRKGEHAGENIIEVWCQ